MRSDRFASAQDGPLGARASILRLQTAFAAPLRYTDGYAWLLLVATLDIVLTWTILHMGGTELNPLAATAIEHGGRAGIIGWKFMTVVIFVFTCEAVGRRHVMAGQRLIFTAVAISAFPVVWSTVLLARY
ncbi:MAG: DUF5658 family protein [Planctomycetota bacterium]